MKTDIKKLKKLGFKKVVSRIEKKKKLARKLSIAYENYRYVSQEKINEFNEGLRAKSQKENPDYYEYDELVLVPVSDYSEAPPLDVLEKIEEATKRNCFDFFEIAKIDSIKEIKDPIVFGRVKGCSDRFFIHQWGEDVEIRDIIEDHEG